ncbi:RNA polymerase sigma factor SigF [Nocardia caishijiensis]|uniref:RNA polymerase sigma-37 (RpsB/SigB) subunit n=1 Tax=Nocardia caishijiensis TaxID=184756 RepID=A0ABQ6YM88_9NOCA|nr:RNA polymerase sigma factor SigF [Nocardia caishijiensis]KAF0846899.1 RNA polymerase sigma-37 (RpsB/SigB) subunit [Nocardia caishijiensis]
MTTAEATKANDSTVRRSHSKGDSYDNIEPWFEKLQALSPNDPQREPLREEVIRLCLPLADHIARKFAGRGELFDDLEQTARVGLVLAVDRYDVSRGSSFLSFAIPTIMGEVRRHFRDHTWAVRVPRRLKEIQLRIGPATEELSQRLGRVPNARELADELEVDLVEVTRALVAGNGYQTNSIDGVTQDDRDNSSQPITETLGAEEHCYELTEDAMAVRPLIAALPEEERDVLIMRFFEGKTQNQIAEHLGVSQMQVSRILSRTLSSLREQALTEETPVQ